MLKISDITVIIPAQFIDALTKKCIFEIKKYYPTVKIIVLVDAHQDNTEIIKNVKIIQTSKATIAKKRNLGVNHADTLLVAFIDSDAYPDKLWLTSALKLFNLNNKLNVVSGPNILPPNSPQSERLIGLCEKSILITINAHYVKERSNQQYVKMMPSCNLIIRKSIYRLIDGMNEKLYGGEDFDFCIKLQNIKQAILYDPDVSVFHKSRDIKGFVLKRLSYGGFIADNIYVLIKTGVIKSLFPLLAILGSLSIFFINAPNIILYSWCLLFISFLIIVLLESKRVSEKFTDIFYLFPLLFVGALIPGVGTTLRLLKLFPDYSRVYKNYE